MRHTLLVLVLAAVALAALLAWWTLSRPGGPSDTAIAEHDVAPFRNIEINGAAEVTLRQGSAERVSILAPTRGLRVSAEVQDGTLVINARDTRRWWHNLFGGARSSRSAKLTVTFRNLESVALAGAVKLTATSLVTPSLRLEAAGGSTLRIEGLRTDSLHVEADGALKAHLAGTATEQHVSIAGASEYNAGDLASQTASVDVSGVGHVVLRVAKTLDASISGAGSVEYYGNPQVNKSVSGVGKVRQRDADAPRVPHLHVA